MRGQWRRHDCQIPGPLIMAMIMDMGSDAGMGTELMG